MYTIHLEKIKVFAYHGVNQTENENGQFFYIDVTARVDADPQSLLDDISNGISYSDINKLVIRLMTQKTYHLLETLCGLLTDEILKTFPAICEVCVKVNKPYAPMKGEFDNVAVSYTRTR